MGERAIINRINKIKELEEKKEEVERELEELRTEIKNDMTDKGINEVQVGKFILRLKEIVTSRFDSKTFKETHKALYEAYIKPQSTMRFTIN